MKKLLLFIACIVVAVGAIAQDRFYIENFNIEPGETKIIEIQLDNVTTFSAIQADIFLPEGLTIDQEDGDYIFDLTDRKARNHTVSAALVSNGAIRILIASEADMTQHNLPDETCTVNPSGSVEPTAQSLTLNTKMAKLQPNNSLQLEVITENAGTITWSSEDESIATVDTNGLVTAVRPGMVAINAMSENGVSTWCAIFVYLPGDVNEDGNRSISDVTTLIDMLLNSN